MTNAELEAKYDQVIELLTNEIATASELMQFKNDVVTRLIAIEEFMKNMNEVAINAMQMVEKMSGSKMLKFLGVGA